MQHLATAVEPVRLMAHPPERGKRPTSVTLASGCCSCCCCCCCLHTIGGLAGALSGSLLTIQPHLRPVDPSFPFPFRRDELDQEDTTFPAAALYWIVVSVLILVVTVGFFVQETMPNFDEPSFLIGGVLIALFCLPAIQLAASLLSLIVVAIFYREKYVSLVRIGKITLWSFVGSMAGALVMAGMCGLLYLGVK